MLDIILIRIIPTKNRNIPNFLFEFILLTLKSKNPKIKLNKAHKTFVKGDESPWPGGLAKGVGKKFPEIPFTKWGTAFVKNPPAKKPAM